MNGRWMFLCVCFLFDGNDRSRLYFDFHSLKHHKTDNEGFFLSYIQWIAATLRCSDFSFFHWCLFEEIPHDILFTRRFALSSDYTCVIENWKGIAVAAFCGLCVSHAWHLCLSHERHETSSQGLWLPMCSTVVTPPHRPCPQNNWTAVKMTSKYFRSVILCQWNLLL